ncbi:MAG: hypothetical protein ABIP94_22090 [Planctomycetota bacterium]
MHNSRRSPFSFLAAGLTALTLASCHSTERAACCGDDSRCCQPEQREQRFEPRSGGQDRMDGPREQPMAQMNGGRDNRSDNRRDDRDGGRDERRNGQPQNGRNQDGGRGFDRTRAEHDQEDRIHLDLHARLDRLTERLAELERRLDEFMGNRRRAPLETRQAPTRR